VTESELIAHLKPLLPTNDFVVTGAGDDCAVLELGAPDTQTLFKTDAVVEASTSPPTPSPNAWGARPWPVA
jgi:thiamine monophosphate kinase